MIGEKRSSHIHGINGLKGIAIIGVTQTSHLQNPYGLCKIDEFNHKK